MLEIIFVIFLFLIFYIGMGYIISLGIDMLLEPKCKTIKKGIVLSGIIWPIVLILMLIIVIICVPILLIKEIKDYLN